MMVDTPMDCNSNVLPRSRSFLEEINEVNQYKIAEFENKIQNYEYQLAKLNKTLQELYNIFLKIKSINLLPFLEIK
jgi:hypothetical protein